MISPNFSYTYVRMYLCNTSRSCLKHVFVEFNEFCFWLCHVLVRAKVETFFQVCLVCTHMYVYSISGVHKYIHTHRMYVCMLEHGQN